MVVKRKAPQKERVATTDPVAIAINEAYRRVRKRSAEAFWAALHDWRDVGEMLKRKRDELQGTKPRSPKWRKWCEANLDFSKRWAEMLIQFVENWQTIATAEPDQLRTVQDVLDLIRYPHKKKADKGRGSGRGSGRRGGGSSGSGTAGPHQTERHMLRKLDKELARKELTQEETRQLIALIRGAGEQLIAMADAKERELAAQLADGSTSVALGGAASFTLSGVDPATAEQSLPNLNDSFRHFFAANDDKQTLLRKSAFGLPSAAQKVGLSRTQLDELLVRFADLRPKDSDNVTQNELTKLDAAVKQFRDDGTLNADGNLTLVTSQS